MHHSDNPDEHGEGTDGAQDALNKLLLKKFLLVHALHVASDVHLLFSTVHAVRTLELRLFAALPLLMITQAAFEFVHATAGRTVETILVKGTGN